MTNLVSQIEAWRRGGDDVDAMRNMLAEIERLRAALREAIAGHKVWESVYGSSPTSRAHLAMLETAVGRQDEPSVEKALQQSSDVLSGRVLQRGPDEPSCREADALDAARYRWVRTAGAFDSEIGLNILSETPEQYDAAVDKARGAK